MKRIKKCFILLFFILLFMPFTLVKADSYATCADVIDAVEELDDIDDMYIRLDCDNATSNQVIYKCNNLRIKKASVLEKIFEYNEDKVCPSIDLSEIIEKYSDECSNRFSSEIKAYADSIMKLFFMSAPFILIIFGSLDFFKIVVANDPKEIKKSRSNFIKRLIAFGLLYVTPYLIHLLFSLTPYDMDGNSFVCSQELVLSPKTAVGEISGIYGGNNYGSCGQAIADAARECKEYSSSHNFSYDDYFQYTGYQRPDIAFTDANKSKTVVCATIVGASIYKSGYYEKDDFPSDYWAYGHNSAPSTARFLRDKGWIFVENQEDLEPGDVMFFQTSAPTYTIINGKSYGAGHVEIYAGDGKRYNTGTTSSIRVVEQSMGYRSNFLFAYRCPGNK